MSDSSFAFGPQGPLIEGDSNFSDGIFTGDVNILSVLDAKVGKSEFPVHKILAVSTVTATATLTVAQVFSGIISATTVSTLTMPTAADLVAGLTAAGELPNVGDSFKLSVVNSSGGSVTIAAGGSTLAPSTFPVVATNSGATFIILVTGVTTPAYTVYYV